MKLPRLQHVAYGCWITIAIVIALSPVPRPDRWNGVFPDFRRAAIDWTEGAETYLPEREYRYPPVTTLLLVPFAYAGDLVGSALWRWFNMIVYIGAVFWAFRVAFPREMPRLARAGILLLLIAPSLTSLHNAQANGLCVGMLIGSAVALRLERYRLAAFLAAGPVGIKIYPIAFGLVACVLRPRRFLPWFTLFLAACVLAPFLAQHPDYVRRQYATLIDLLKGDSRTSDVTLMYRDLRLVGQAFGMTLSDGAYQVIQVTAGGGIALLCFLGGRAGWSADRLFGYALALCCCWMTVFGPATEKATFIFTTPVLAWCLIEARVDERRGAMWFYIVLYAMYVVPLLAGKQVYRSLPARVALPLATLVLFGALVARAVADLRAPPAARS